MSDYLSNVDVGNRALIHLGAELITSFAQGSRNALLISAVYDKIRRAELRRRVWRFATRRVALRPITTASLMLVPATWASNTTYAQGAIVQDSSGFYWQSMAASNVGNTPATSPTWWEAYAGNIVSNAYSASISYYGGELVNSGGTLYLSLANANLNNTPSSGAPWLSLGTSTAPIVFLTPAGFDKLGATQLSVYRMPWGFLRAAPQDTKQPGVSYLGTTAGMKYTDFELEGNLLYTSNTGPIIFRYVADVTNTVTMDDTFAESLAAAIGFNLAESITQSKEKRGDVAQTYQTYIEQAHLINAIEVGSTEGAEENFGTPDRGAGEMQRGGPQQ